MVKKGTTEDVYNEFMRRFPESIHGDEATHHFKKWVDGHEDTYLDGVQDTEGSPSLPTSEIKGIPLIISHLLQILKKLIRKSSRCISGHPKNGFMILLNGGGGFGNLLIGSYDS